MEALLALGGSQLYCVCLAITKFCGASDLRKSRLQGYFQYGWVQWWGKAVALTSARS